MPFKCFFYILILIKVKSYLTVDIFLDRSFCMMQFYLSKSRKLRNISIRHLFDLRPVLLKAEYLES